MAVARNGDDGFLWFEILFALPLLAAPPLLLVALIGLCFRRVRRGSALVALCSAAYLVAFPVSVQIGQRIRMRAFHQLAERSKPLIEAIRGFEQKHGRPPESLEALVPEFMPSIPSTGVRAYPEYDYSTASKNFDGNPWVLTVSTPSGGINFDQFMYFPLTNYPEQGYGGWLERVGDWAYVHE